MTDSRSTESILPNVLAKNILMQNIPNFIKVSSTLCNSGSTPDHLQVQVQGRTINGNYSILIPLGMKVVNKLGLELFEGTSNNPYYFQMRYCKSRILQRK